MRLSFNEGKPLISGRSIVFINVIVSLHCDCGRVNRLVACAHLIARDVYTTEVYTSLGKTGFEPPPPLMHIKINSISAYIPILTTLFNFQIIQDYERAVVFRLGRLQPLKQPGQLLE